MGLVDIVVKALPRFESAVSRGYKGVRLLIALRRIELEKSKAC